MYLSDKDFDTAFNSPDHADLWRWMRELNVPGVDQLQSLCEQRTPHGIADLPYGMSAPVFRTRCGERGDKLSPQLFTPRFFALLPALRATGVVFRMVTGLRAPAGGFAMQEPGRQHTS